MFFYLRARGQQFSVDTTDGVFSTFTLPHQIPKVAEGISGQLYDALCEAAVMTDEAGEDSGQTMASSVQHHGSGDSLYCHLGAAAVCNVANEEHSECVIYFNSYFLVEFLLFFFLQHLGIFKSNWVRCGGTGLGVGKLAASWRDSEVTLIPESLNAREAYSC